VSDAPQTPKITPLKNGPLVLDDHGVAGCLSRADGTAHEVHGTAVLCRCGGSSRKPFCDGTHASIGFTSECMSDRRQDHRDDYEADGITVHDNRQACAHAEHCIQGAPEVFHRMHRPWITPEAAAPDTIAAVVERCPSGALSYSRDGVEHRDLDRTPQVLVRPGGPYEVSGGVELEVGEGEWARHVSREHYTLCRCGGSSNKPFCDGTHWKNGFADAGE
jgi:CDGSH-type Zn-finger protein